MLRVCDWQTESDLDSIFNYRDVLLKFDSLISDNQSWTRRDIVVNTKRYSYMIYPKLAHRMPYFSVLGILKYGIGWRPQNAPFENCSIWEMFDLRIAPFEKCSIWELLDLRNARFENCSIWELLNVRFAKFEKCWIWQMLDLRIVWANLRKSYRFKQA